MMKNLNLRVYVNDNKRKHLVCNSKCIYFFKPFGKHFVDHLALNYYNALPLNLKIDIYLNKILKIEKYIIEWLLLSFI